MTAARKDPQRRSQKGTGEIRPKRSPKGTGEIDPPIGLPKISPHPKKISEEGLKTYIAGEEEGGTSERGKKGDELAGGSKGKKRPKRGQAHENSLFRLSLWTTVYSLHLFPAMGIAIAFGLLHGLGFAPALGEIGLPKADIPAALFSTNTPNDLS